MMVWLKGDSFEIWAIFGIYVRFSVVLLENTTKPWKMKVLNPQCMGYNRYNL